MLFKISFLNIFGCKVVDTIFIIKALRLFSIIIMLLKYTFVESITAK